MINLEQKEISDSLEKSKTYAIVDLNKHQIVDNFGFKLNIDYAPREIPLDKIAIDLKNFQNRKKPYSEHSVQNIIDAVLNWNFDFRIFNPIIVWRNSQDGRLYILSWHSRYEAFKLLSTEYKSHPWVLEFVKKNWYNFDNIFSMIMDDITFESAKFIALMSNALATIESDTERAEIYRSFRQLWESKKFIEEFGRKCEKSNRPRIESYSFLNPNWSIISTLESFEKNTDDINIIRRVAKWIWWFRMKYPEISDLHENELFVWLIDKWWYWNKNWQINTQSKFFEVVWRHLEEIKNKWLFNPDYSLNILKIQSLSDCMKNYYHTLNELKNKKQEVLTEFHVLRRKLNKRIVNENRVEEINLLKEKLENELWIIINNLSRYEQVESFLFNIDDFIQEDNINKIINDIRDYVNKLEQDYYKLKSKKWYYLQSSKNEIKLEF